MWHMQLRCNPCAKDLLTSWYFRLLDVLCKRSRQLSTVSGSIWRSPATPIYVQTRPLVLPFMLQPDHAIYLLLLQLVHSCVLVVTAPPTHRGLKPFDQDLALGSGQLIGHEHVV